MAKFGAWTNGFLQVNGTNLSDHCEQFDIDQSVEALEFHAHGDIAKIKTPGLKDITVTARFYTDLAASKCMQILRPLYDNRTNHALLMKPASGTSTATNPQWSGNFFISKFKPITGKHGETVMTEVTFSPTSDLTYAEA